MNNDVIERAKAIAKLRKETNSKDSGVAFYAYGNLGGRAYEMASLISELLTLVPEDKDEWIKEILRICDQTPPLTINKEHSEGWKWLARYIKQALPTLPKQEQSQRRSKMLIDKIKELQKAPFLERSIVDTEELFTQMARGLIAVDDVLKEMEETEKARDGSYFAGEIFEEIRKAIEGE